MPGVQILAGVARAAKSIYGDVLTRGSGSGPRRLRDDESLMPTSGPPLNNSRDTGNGCL